MWPTFTSDFVATCGTVLPGFVAVGSPLPVVGAGVAPDVVVVPLGATGFVPGTPAGVGRPAAGAPLSVVVPSPESVAVPGAAARVPVSPAARAISARSTCEPHPDRARLRHTAALAA